MKILIVEDDLVVVRIIDLILRKHGFQSTAKYSGQEALNYLSSHQDVDLVILDIIMPGMDGIQVLERMNEKQEMRDIPVIVCTSRKDAETVQRAVSLGAAGYIVKPVNAGMLVQKVREVLGIEEDE